MRKAIYWLGLFLSLAAVLFGSPSTGISQTRDARAGQRQTRDRFVISAKAGGINAVTGRAQVHGKGTDEWQLLTIKEDLVAGDVVKTGLESHVEMLLNPGSYLRVGENSEFELTDNSLENLEVRLLRGTAIVEATGAEDTELFITITTPDTKMSIIKRGLYRLNVVPGDGTELIVRKGRVMLSDSHTKIKDGNKVIFSSSGVSVAKLQKAEKKAFDDLDTWSKARAETVAKANRKIRGRDLSLALASYNDFWFSGFSRYRPRTQGMWVYNGAYNCYTFIPFSLGMGFALWRFLLEWVLRLLRQSQDLQQQSWWLWRREYGWWRLRHWRWRKSRGWIRWRWRQRRDSTCTPTNDDKCPA
jgi:hypothetical protein